MLLQALYKYAQDHNLARPEGCVEKSPHAYIRLTSDGTYVGLELDKQPVICPSVGSLACGTKSDVLLEKRSIVLGDPEESTKTAFFLESLESAGAYNPDILLFLKALKDKETREAIAQDCGANKVKAGDRITCKVDGRSIIDNPKTFEWWSEFRKGLKGNKREGELPCFVTGEIAPPVHVMRKVNGLMGVGGHKSGDALICFDKAAFQSYNFSKEENCPMSEAACDAITLAYEALLKTGIDIAGARYVHWFDAPIEQEQDPIYALINGFSSDEERDKDEVEARANAQARNLVKSIFSGDYVAPINNTYHMLVVSGVNGRVMIRDYHVGTYDELYKSIRQWYDDTAIVGFDGINFAKHYKLTGMMPALLRAKKGESISKLMERVASELASVAPRVMNAIMYGAPLTDAIAARALANVRSKLVTTEEQHPMPDVRASQWLKAYLVGKERNKYNEEVTMPFINANHPVTAYHCGRLFAVYAKIQEFSLLFEKGSKNKHAPTVVTKYYAACSQSPAYVLNQLQRLSTHHLSKLADSSKWWSETLDEMASSIAVVIGDNMPKVLTTEEQAYFVLGYRQQAADILRILNERRAEFKAKEEAAAEED